jgi:pilus assembly protein TadC
MTQSKRKALGIVLTLISLVVWSILAVWLYETAIAGLPNWALLIYFVVAGMGWVLPAMVIIRWMARPD